MIGMASEGKGNPVAARRRCCVPWRIDGITATINVFLRTMLALVEASS